MNTMSFTFGTDEIKFSYEYRKRKTLCIKVIGPDNVHVIAPKSVSKKEILTTVKNKAKWIIRKMSEIQELEEKKPTREYVDGELFMYLGRNIPLKLIFDETIRKPRVNLDHGNFVITSNTKDELILKHAMEEWYRNKTLQLILERIDYYQAYINEKPNVVRVKEQKKRWGSCSSKKSLNFNWRCSMAPINVVDYIVVHEMCHLEHMNHSKDFWQRVQMIFPDYKRSKEWLKKHSVMMCH